MPKSYSKFTLEDLSDLDIRVVESCVIDKNKVAEVAPSQLLKDILEINTKLKLRTEKAKSELLISPILVEMVSKNTATFSFFSGYKFNVDAKIGLNGFCDYILTLDPSSYAISSPVFCVVEAKNDNLDEGIAQCIAEMYAAQLFNKKKNNNLSTIYGAVTFGFEWKFIKLVEKQADVDTEIYFLNKLPELLGALQHIIDLSSKQ